MTTDVVGEAARELYELIPDGIIVVQEDMHITYASSRAEALFGYELGELAGLPLEMLIPAALRERHQQHIGKFVKAPTSRRMHSGLELKALHKNGSEFAIDVSLSPVPSPTGLLMVAGVRDRTHAAATAKELRRSEGLLQALVRSVPNTAIFATDGSGIISGWNLGATGVTGYVGADTIGKSYRMLYPKAARDTAEPERLAAAAAETDTGLAHGWLLRSDGSRFFAITSMTAIPVPDASSADAFAVGVRDITESVLTTARLASFSAFDEVRFGGTGRAPLFRLLVELINDALSPRSTAFTVTGSEKLQLAKDGAAPALFSLPAGDPRALGEVGASTEIQIGSRREIFGTLQVTHDQETPVFTMLELDFIRDVASALVRTIARQRARRDQERLSIRDDQERMARDLHDSVIQRIFGVGLALQATMGQISDQNTRTDISDVIDDLDRCIAALRSAIYRLESSSDEHEIHQKVLELVARFAPALGFMPAVQFEGPSEVNLAGLVAQDTLKSLRELLSNVAKHASATRVDILLHISDELVLTVTDNGLGIGPSVESTGNGLRNLASRADAHGGEFRWRCGETGGTVATWLARDLVGYGA